MKRTGTIVAAAVIIVICIALLKGLSDAIWFETLFADRDEKGQLITDGPPSVDGKIVALKFGGPNSKRSLMLAIPKTYLSQASLKRTDNEDPILMWIYAPCLYPLGGPPDNFVTVCGNDPQRKLSLALRYRGADALQSFLSSIPQRLERKSLAISESSPGSVIYISIDPKVSNSNYILRIDTNEPNVGQLSWLATCTTLVAVPRCTVEIPWRTNHLISFNDDLGNRSGWDALAKRIKTMFDGFADHPSGNDGVREGK